jgi:hypothetical protein
LERENVKTASHSLRAQLHLRFNVLTFLTF